MGVLEDQLVALYQSSLTDYIDYWLGGLHVTTMTFREVAAAVERGLITVARSSDPTLAVYNSRTDHLEVVSFRGNLTSVANATTAALAIHEAVHVYCDMHQARSTDPISEEVAAYIAQTIYIRNRSGGRSALTSDDDPAERAMFEAVRRLCERHNLFSHATSDPRHHLSRADIEEARQSVLSFHVYSHLAGVTTSPHHDGLARSRSCGLFGMSRCEPPAIDSPPPGGGSG